MLESVRHGSVHVSTSDARHLDLRYTGLCGEAATLHIASILEAFQPPRPSCQRHSAVCFFLTPASQGNGALSHLELSWNPLGASAGQARGELPLSVPPCPTCPACPGPPEKHSLHFGAFRLPTQRLQALSPPGPKISCSSLPQAS